jgi:hypothetical protein
MSTLIHYSSFDPILLRQVARLDREHDDPRSNNLIFPSACASVPEVGAQCVSCACWDLRGGCRVTGIPTATIYLWWVTDADPPEVDCEPIIAK